jgi:hypothetical protein
LVLLGNGVFKVDRLYVLYTEDQVIGERLQEVWLGFQGQTMVGIATKDH